MAALDDALARLHTDPAFRAAVAVDPSVALREHPLGPDDLPVLAEAAVIAVRRLGPAVTG